MKTLPQKHLINCLAGRSATRTLAAIVLAGLAAGTVSAQTSGVWTNKANGNWNTAANWQGGNIASGSDASADFASITWTNGHQTTLDAACTVGSLKFGNLSGAANTNFLVGASTLTLQTSSGNPAINASNQYAVVGAPLASSQQVLVAGNSVVITNAATGAGVSSGWILQAGQECFMGANALGSGPVTVGSSVGSAQTGFNMIDPAAAGTVPAILANNFTVQTIRWIIGQSGCTLNAQPLVLNGVIMLNSGTANVRDIYPFQPVTINGQVTGGGNYGIQLNGTAPLTLANSGNDFSGDVTFTSANILGVNSDGALGSSANKISMNSSGNTLRIDAPFTTVRNIALGSTVCNFNVQTNTLEVDSLYGTTISGSGGLTVLGSTNGVMILTGGNTYTGATTVNSSGPTPGSTTLALYGSGNIASTSIVVGTNAAFVASDSATLPNLSSVTVNNGGLVILSNSPSWNSAASFTLNGANARLDVAAYSGAFAINSGGTLAGMGTVAGTATLAAGSQIAPGTAGTAGTLVFNGNLTLNGQTIQFDLSTNLVEGGGTNDEIVAGGNLVLGGGEKIMLNYLNGSLSAGTYKLFKFGGTLTGSFSLLASYPNVTLDNGVGTPGYVTLVVGTGGSGGNNLFWKGDGAANLWDIATTANWVTNFAYAPLTYNDAAKVTFNDFGSNNVPVTLNSTVYPNGVTFNLTNKACTLSGSGQIAGMVGVVITGGNCLTNNLANTYTGGTILSNSSVLVLGDSASVGPGTINAGSGTAKVVANSSTAISLPRVTATAAGPKVVQSGTGTTTLTGSGDNSYMGVVVNNGVLVLGKTSSSSVHSFGSGGATVNGGVLQLGGSGGDQIAASGSVNLAGGAFDQAGLSESLTQINGYGVISNSAGGGGTISLTGNQGLAPAGGTMTILNGVTLSLPSTATGSAGVQGGATLNVAGGTVNCAGYFTVGASGGTGTAFMNLSGGAFTIGGNAEFLNAFQRPATLTLSGSAVLTCYNFSYGNNATTNYLYGGTLNCTHFNVRGAGPNIMFFNGTTIQPQSSQATFNVNGTVAQKLTAGYISTNGLIWNDNGNNVTWTEDFLPDPALGGALDGGLTKQGAGVFTSLGTNTFRGPVTVSGGALVLNNFGNFSAITVADGATNQINMMFAGRSQTNSALTLGTSSGNANLAVNLGTLGVPTAPVLRVKGTVTNLGPVTVTLSATPILPVGTIPLIQYDSMDAANFLATWSVAPVNYYTLTLTNDTVNHLISVVVAVGSVPVWSGSVNSTWDTATANWKSNSTSITWPDGSPVSFDDTAANFLVDISSASVSPGFISMNNTKAYTFSGSQGISGATAIIKSGTGTLILSNTANTYSGTTLINGGTLAAAAANVLSSSSATTLAGSSLDVSSNNQAIGTLTLNNSSLLGTATLTGTSAGTLTFNNSTPLTPAVTLAGSMAVTFSGSAEVTLTNAASFASSGSAVNVVQINGTGGVRCQNGAAFGPLIGSGNFNDNLSVVIAAGSRLVLDGSFTLGKYLKFSGTGPDGLGALVVTNGNVVVNGAPCALNANTTFYVSAGSSVLFQGNASSGGNATKFFAAGVLTKTGPGKLMCDAGSDNGAGKLINAGSFVISNTTVTGPVTINSGAAMTGFGTVSAVFNVKSGGTLAPNGGIDGVTGTLTLGGLATNAGAIQLTLLKTSSATNNDQIVCTSAFVNQGTLAVNNNAASTAAFAAGDSFKLFSLTNYTALSGLTPSSLPGLPTGLGWTNGLAVDGTIGVAVAINTNSFAITNVISGGQLTLSWPADRTGWRLQCQTNPASTGLNPAVWYDVPGSTTVNTETFSMDPAAPCVFFRMVYP